MHFLCTNRFLNVFLVSKGPSPLVSLVRGAGVLFVKGGFSGTESSRETR